MKTLNIIAALLAELDSFPLPHSASHLLTSYHIHSAHLVDPSSSLIVYRDSHPNSISAKGPINQLVQSQFGANFLDIITL